MGLKHSYLQLVTAIAVSSALILSACQMRDQSVVGKFAGGGHGGGNAGEATLPGRTALTPELKKFIVDPTTLEAYKSNLAPLLAKLTKQSTFPWAAILNLKSWLIGSMNLEKMPGATLAMTYSNTTSAALSRQTQYEVWIDSDQTESMSDADKADLLLNELLTNIYLMRNLSDLEICKLVTLTYPASPECRSTIKSDADAAAADTDVKKDQKKNKLGSKTALQKMTADAIARPRGPLTQLDANNIAVVKNYIHQQADKLNYPELILKMGQTGFDLRIFKFKIKPTAPKAAVDSEGDTNTADETLDTLTASENSSQQLQE